MTSELGLRLIGMVILSIVGARLGAEIAVPPFSVEAFALIFGLVGSITGLVITPYVTTRPARYARRAVTSVSGEALVTTLFGLIFGMIIAALLAAPLGLLPQPLGQWLPTVAAVALGYLMITIFSVRANDLIATFNRYVRPPIGGTPGFSGIPVQEEVQILLDTSVIIDGRVLDISKTGFLLGTLLVPRFVLAELQHIADSADVLKRTRGRRGLEILDQLQKESRAPVKIIDADVEGVREVDDKLVLLARQLNARLMTNDFNLNGVAKLQGIPVMNINELANAVKAVFLPNEQMTIHIIQEGREPNQGVGYLVDGTMVVVEDGKRYIDRTIEVVVTRMIQTAAGKMYFARPTGS
jgi:uncharacterized protein YacL